MSCSRLLLILSLVLKLAHGVDIMDIDAGEEEVTIKHNVTGILGEDVYLSCHYRGHDPINHSVWKRRVNDSGFKWLAGFHDGRPFSRNREDVSLPSSPTNLTLKMRVSSMEAEAQYTCTFKTLDDHEFMRSMFLKVQVRPETDVWVNEDVINGTSYQTVRCSALGGKPAPQISWLIDRRPPHGEHFSAETSETVVHPNGTTGVRGALRFPTHLQDEDRVTCVVEHPTLPVPKHTAVSVETYAAPNVSLEAEMVREVTAEAEREYWVVSCVASGGRPETEISLATTAEEKPQRENGTGTHAYRLPARVYEGHNVTCVFDQPKLARKQFRGIRLPSFYVSGARLFPWPANASGEAQAIEQLELEETQSGVALGLEAIGNVPRYAVSCKKDNDSLPNGVEVVGTVLAFHGRVDLLHAGLYECEVSYYRHRATVRFNVTVKPQVIPPALVPPSIKVALRNGAPDGVVVVECWASGGVPAANVSWLLPEGVSPVPGVNVTLRNGSCSVGGVVLLPACPARQLTVGCVTAHPLFEKPEIRNVTLPVCARPNISLSTRSEWRADEVYTVAQCCVESIAPAATITWRLGDGGSDIGHTQRVDGRPEVQADGTAIALSTLHFPSFLYSGQNLSCVVDHHSLAGQERRDVAIAVFEAPVLHVSVKGQRDSLLWLAVCHYAGRGVRANLTWIVPENTGGRMSEGKPTMKTKLTYQFPLISHEGQDLTCLIRYHGGSQRRTIHIPIYYISSVTVLNQTSRRRHRYGGDHGILRIALQESLTSQTIVLRVNGNVPTYNLTCQRSDGSIVHMEGVALVFRGNGQHGGLYACHASFYHHNATAYIHVEVLSPDVHLCTLVIICISSSAPLSLFLFVALWVFCEINQGTREPRSKERESLTARTSLIHHQRSPEMKKDLQQNTCLVGYSVVIDVKSSV